MDDLIAALKGEAEVVLFDSPPVLAVADATILSTKVQGVLLVVEMGRTRSEIAQRAVEALRQVEARLLGVVMNKISRQRGGYYYYYYDSGEGGQVIRRWRRPKGLLGRLLPSNFLRRPPSHAGPPPQPSIPQEHPAP